MPPIEGYDNANAVAARKMKTPEEKIAHELAKDFIGYKLGKGTRLNTKSALILRKLSNQIENKHELFLRNMCDRLDIRQHNAPETFKQVADEIFGDGINWGRIVVLYTFAGKVAKYCQENQLDNAENVATWVGNYVASKSDWVKKAGGWEAFNEQFKDVQEEHEKFWWNSLLCTTLGLGSLAAVLYMKS
ncbi:predicted protein [Nematostella vectensis]|uniref:Bcl-2 Bcl-2 homology region 1-3 domain-containing protein n=1 Tax=Nematostella vectensis TaxID=45351 RepID=A7SPR2_NEMVE|nr:apoptosis regulator Bcl-2 [Nematostella vectensis]EDO34312.1 predicted protein [Nematostella vectensis]|eukprot:XP_001626412.1 predicted protein [Nematostella vectensis]